jgi:S-layer protein (TIGR01564 family)
VLLKNLSSTAPLVVLDSSANPDSNLILVGSGLVNSLSQTLESSYSIPMTSTSTPVAQAYGDNRILVAGYYANQTTAEANSFINQLYTAAASST